MRSIDAEVGQFVPVVAAVQRRTSDDGQLDRINVDVRVAPYSQTRIVKWARMLGPAETIRVAPIAGDVASLEVSVDALGQPVHLFGGLRDFRTPLVVRQGEAKPDSGRQQNISAATSAPGRGRSCCSIASWVGPLGPPDADGIAQHDGCSISGSSGTTISSCSRFSATC